MALKGNIPGITVTGPDCPYCKKPLTTTNARCVLRHENHRAMDRYASVPGGKVDTVVLQAADGSFEDRAL
jgi:hypothetical protein